MLIHRALLIIFHWIFLCVERGVEVGVADHSNKEFDVAHSLRTIEGTVSVFLIFLKSQNVCLLLYNGEIYLL